jgi:hypothetical protein
LPVTILIFRLPHEPTRVPVGNLPKIPAHTFAGILVIPEQRKHPLAQVAHSALGCAGNALSGQRGGGDLAVTLTA